MRFRKILVPTDFSANAQLAFNVAYHLAQSTGADLEVLHVQGESSVRTAAKENLIQRGSTSLSIQEAVEELQDARFAEITAGLGSDVPIRCVTARGDPDAAIVEYALENRADLMVVGLRGSGARNQIRATLLGSVAEAMIRKSPCPVLVVRPDHEIEPPAI
jgi:nucleotide-binding universal stress UspA family protein